MFFGSKHVIMYISMLILLTAAPAAADNQLPVKIMTLVQDEVVVNGRVSEKGSGLPVSNVIVGWEGCRESTLTRADGTYSIHIVAGCNKLHFSKPGWKDRSRKFRDGKTINIKMRKEKRKNIPFQPEEDLPPDSLKRVFPGP
jgi:hypothetical protein